MKIQHCIGQSSELTQHTGGLVAWLAARVKDWNGKRNVVSRQLGLVETLSLGGRRQLMLVSCGEERYLVGGGPDSIETIVHVDGAGLGSRGAETPCA